MVEHACCVVLAAGDGKRMKSQYPKVMCKILDKPMILWVTDSVYKAGISDCCVVVGNNAELISAVLPSGCETVLQAERLGTGHAASMAVPFLQKTGAKDVCVLFGDSPLLSPEELAASLAQHRAQKNHVTLLTARLQNPSGYGRIVRDGEQVAAIVEQADATPEQLEITEINSGACWFDAAFLQVFFQNMTAENKQGEYYLTESVAYARKNGYRTGAYTAGADAVLGANDRTALAHLNRVVRERIIYQHRRNGVDIPLDDGVLIGPDVTIGQDTTILTGSVILGDSQIGTDCEIGPNSYLANAVVGNHCLVRSSYIDRSTLEDRVRVGPMSNLRPGTILRAGVKIGDFVEVKNSDIGSGTAISHLTYVGDSDVGSECNFGCGVVTVNYDGSQKHRTTVGNRVFVGCNCNLIAPVTLGDNVYAAAGTTITDNVPDGALVIGRSRQTIKPDWAKKKRLFGK